MLTDTQRYMAPARLGFGLRADETLPDDPFAWADAQIKAEDPFALTNLDASNAALVAFIGALRKKRDAFKSGALPGNPPGQPKIPSPEQARAHEAMVATLQNTLATTQAFRERLVWFWSNHFTVAAQNNVITAMLPAYWREAIRPHVTGRFADMLLAVMRHPAMLEYLNQHQSVGPNSRHGMKSGRGLNENLARECLELHTVTPASGYTQADVTAFARVLTGWTFMLDNPPGFQFRANWHEPGEQVVMGQTIAAGEEGGIAFLNWLASHPATHKHLAEKLVRHFTTDQPDINDIETITAVLRDTNGDLAAASSALLRLPSVWRPLTKFRTPFDYAVAAMRAVGAAPEDAHTLLPALRQLGQDWGRTPFPIGWSDRAADWAGSEALLQRADFIYTLAGRANIADPLDVAARQLGPLLGNDTRNAVKHAGSRQDALALLFSSPEFQRR
jgi:uncharacterized protein (DUF1800 family)